MLFMPLNKKKKRAGILAWGRGFHNKESTVGAEVIRIVSFLHYIYSYGSIEISFHKNDTASKHSVKRESFPSSNKADIIL